MDRLLHAAAEALRRSGKDGQLDGYTAGSRARVWEMASAIWTAVCAQGLDYALPPASFEDTGQKVRPPSAILDCRRATCLDTSLLFAACFEQAGLNPVVVLTRGHAFAGVWLRPTEFAAAVLEDPVALRNQVKLDELLVFETTFATQHPPGGFRAAIGKGQAQIAEERDEGFAAVVDVRRARMHRIAALPTPGAHAPGHEADEAGAAAVPALEEAPALPNFGDDPDAPAMPTPQGRLERWQRKLLDLSLRNPLLNFKHGRKSVRLVCPDPGRLEDLLADGAEVRLRPAPKLVDEASGRSGEVIETRTGERVEQAHALDALAKKEVFVDLEAQELDARLTALFRAARADLQEGGSNTLHLAFGFLVWRRSDDKADKRHRAPLILLPVSLQRSSVRAGFKVTLHEDEARFNPTLVEMLEQDFALRLRDFDEALPLDASGLDVAKVWNRTRQVVQETPGFEVAEEVTLSTFSFAKFLMWKDLAERADALKRSPLVRHLIDTPTEAYAEGGEVAFRPLRGLDRSLPPQDVFAPLPADSSQLRAVAASADGKDFVLIGPPGTGKSQTIANLIAQNLAQGRTVLFVAEKTAALDVVYRRLREHGLGEFCLELHSNKARKLDVLNQLDAAWTASGTHDGATWRREAERLAAVRDQLNALAERLHAEHPNGWTVHRAIGVSVEGRERRTPALAWPSPDAHSSGCTRPRGRSTCTRDPWATWPTTRCRRWRAANGRRPGRAS